MSKDLSIGTQNSEEATRLRANAASLIIMNQLDSKQTAWVFSNFKIQSTTSEELADNEFRQLIAIHKRLSELLEQTISAVSVTSSAISASIYPSNTATRLTSIIDSSNTANNILKEVEQQFQQFNESTNDLFVQRGIIVSIQEKLNKLLTEITTNILSQLHLLLFGDGRP